MAPATLAPSKVNESDILSDNVSTFDMNIGPSEAEFFLTGFNTHNRTLKQGHVDNLARQMQRGEWKFNGDPIRFSKDGTLLDGQHRLWAIIESGTTQKFTVVTGLSSDTQETIDTGVKRTMGDMLKLRGYHNTNQLAAMARNILTWRVYADPGRKSVATPGQVFAFIEANYESMQESINAGAAAWKQLQRPSKTWLATLHYLFKNVDAQECDRFFESLKTGVDLSSGDPIFILRSYLQKFQRASKYGFVKDIAVFIKAWEAWRHGAKIQFLSWRPGANEAFPTITDLAL